MKTTPFLLALSFLANLGFLAWDQVPRPAFARKLETPKPSLTLGNAAAPTTASPAMNLDAVIEALKNDNSDLVADFLKHAGLDQDSRNALLQGWIRHKYDKRRAVEVPADPALPYWKNSWRTRHAISPEKRAKYEAIWTQQKEEMNRVCPEPETQVEPSSYAYLPESTRSKLQALEEDYSTMRLELHNEIGGFELESDDKKMSILAEEERKERDALLSPAEKEAIALRESHLAWTLINKFNSVLNSEEEFKTLYGISSEKERREKELMEADLATPAALRQVEMDAEAKMSALLGAERIARLRNETDPDRSLAEAAAKRMGIGDSGTQQLLALRDQMANQSRLIADCAGISSDEKQAMLKRLHEQAEFQLKAILGGEAAKTYLRDTVWTDQLKRGRAFTRSLSGEYTIIRVAPTP